MNKNEMLAMRLDGETYQAIGDKAGLTRQRIQQILAPPPDVRDVIVANANGRCQLCGIKVDGSGHVHHIANLLEEDYDDTYNLRLLCCSCHRRQHNKTRMWFFCLTCGEPLVKQQHYYCSHSCVMIASHNRSTDILTCEVCHCLFKRRRSKIKAAQKRNYQHTFCSKQCNGKWFAKNHGWGVHPHHKRTKTKWDYAIVYQAQADTGFGAMRLSRLLGIPAPTISFILRKRSEIDSLNKNKGEK